MLGDLEGLKVSHDFDEMDEGESRILTLKDSRILDNEGTHWVPVVVSSFLIICRGRTSERRNGRRREPEKSSRTESEEA